MAKCKVVVYEYEPFKHVVDEYEIEMPDEMILKEMEENDE